MFSPQVSNCRLISNNSYCRHFVESFFPFGCVYDISLLNVPGGILPHRGEPPRNGVSESRLELGVNYPKNTLDFRKPMRIRMIINL